MNRYTPTLLLSMLLFCISYVSVCAAEWEGKQTEWNGCQRFDFVVDGRPSFVVVPNHPAPGNPWVWRARFPSFHAEADAILLERGFHIAHINTGGMLGSPTALKHWDVFYDLVTQQHGLAKKPALEAVSRGGLFAYRWTAKHPDRVACLYADTPVCDIKSWPLGQGTGIGSKPTWQNLLKEFDFSEQQALEFRENPIDVLAPIADAKIPLLHLVSMNDRVVPPDENTFVLAQRYRELGGSIEIMRVKEGTEKSNGHHFTHPDPERVADFIERHARLTKEVSTVTPPLSIQLELASPFGEHMVLQRQHPIPVWGWAEPGETITVVIAGSHASATVGTDGRWRCDLAPLEAGGPYEFTASDGKTFVRYEDVLVGEVWICCGQSNMQMGHNGIPDIAKLVKETTTAGRPVRSLTVLQSISFEEEDRVKTQWATTPPGSAVAAAFACRLQSAIDVPVGVVVAAWGSSSLEGWMPADLTEQLPHFDAIMKAHNADKTIAQMIIDAKKEGQPIIKYSDDPQQNARLTKQHRNANIYARTRPNMLYNAMLHPLIPMATRGMVYYQGEANSKNAEDMLRYGISQRAWLNRLRKGWGRDDWRLMSVMLPGFSRQSDLESVDIPTWAIIRDQQLKILELPLTAVANTIDLGNAKNIHPKDKMPIGERLALLARRDTCGETQLVAQGPTYTGMKFDGRRVTLRFDHAKGLSTTDGQSPKAFWVSGENNKWHRAEARIDGQTIILSAPEGITPQHVRYAYAAKPAVNLINQAELPAYPFSTN